MLVGLAENTGEKYGTRGSVVDEVSERMICGEYSRLGRSAASEAEQSRGSSRGRALLGKLDLGPVDGVTQVNAALAFLAESTEVGGGVQHGFSSHGAEEIFDGQVSFEAELGDGQLDVARLHSVVQDVTELLGAVGVVREATQELAHAVGFGRTCRTDLLHGHEGRKKDVHRYVVALVWKLKDVNSQLFGYHCKLITDISLLKFQIINHICCQF